MSNTPSLRLLACKHFRWMPGMLCVWPNGNYYRVAQVTGIDGINPIPNYPCNGWGDDYPDKTAGHPDLSDPATVGCLMQLVREAWRQEGIATLCGESYWRVHSPIMKLGFPYMDNDYNTEAAALVAALEAAP
jgi:hypothetical protein